MINLFKKYAFVILLIIATSTLIIVLVTRAYFGQASVNGKKDFQLSSGFVLAQVPEIAPIKINFQDEKTVPPPGWMKDIGEPFSAHAGVYQGSQLMYGWKSAKNNQPIDLTGNGRSRTEPEDVLISTFVHMQADDIGIRYGAFKGVKAKGYWEIKVLNGVYKVAVAVGDAIGKAEEIDCINVEGVQTVVNFRPIGKMRSPGRFRTAVVTVTVQDGYLTIDANGGKNTKICYAEITPVTMMPYVYVTSENQNLLVNKDEASKAPFINLKINNSTHEHVAYNLKVDYKTSAKSWLNFKSETAKEIL